MTDQITLYVVTFIAGVIIAHIFSRIINRLTILRFSVWHQHIGLSGEDPNFGTVEISYNKNPVKSLYFSTVALTNESNKDLTNLDLNVICDQASAIIKSQAQIKSSLNQLQFTEKYEEMLNRADPDLAGYAAGRRDYFVPVFNRRETINMTLLVTNFTGVQPIITVACDHAGVKVKFQKQQPQMVFGESGGLSILVGLIITSLVCYLLIRYQVKLSEGVWYSYILGVLSTIVGAFLIKFWKAIKRLFN